ncbi:MAG: non-homologous end joining protein Ku [Thermoanaerobaculia bacterium]
MPHAIWNGSISFGLVTIPVKLFTAIRENEGIHFHLLHAKDKGRIHNARKCEADGREVSWDEIVRGYEYEKGHYLVVTEDELKKFRPEATQTVEIREFVDLTEIDPMLFDKPYYLEPEKKGKHAYALLRDALKKSGKVGIAQVVLRTREYLAAVKPAGEALVLEMMHFADEIVRPRDLELPPAHEKTSEGEMKAAMMLIDAMAKHFEPGEFHDTYREELRAHLEARAHGQTEPKGKAAKLPKPTNVVDLMDVLQKSLQQSKHAGEKRPKLAKTKGRHAPARANHGGHRKAS